MKSIRTFAAFAAFSYFAAMAAAQTITVPEELVAGQTVTIGLSDSGNAGKTVIVTVTSENNDSKEVEIQLDGSGNGSGSFTVPPWGEAHFTAPGASEVVREIQGSLCVVLPIAW